MSGRYGNPGKWDNMLRSRESSLRGDERGSRSDLGALSGSRNPMQTCWCCGRAHLEDPGFGVCKWRSTHPTWEPLSAEFRGWDPKYCASKKYRAQKARAYWMTEMAEGHPAMMSTKERKAFFTKVKEMSL